MAEKDKKEGSRQTRANDNDPNGSAAEKVSIKILAEQPKVRIIIPSGRGAHERAPVPVAVNGREFLIERDKEVDVPESVLGVLDLAIERIPQPVGEGVERRYVMQESPAFPYRVVGQAGDSKE